MKRKIKFTNIKWDTDNKSVKLPNFVTLEIDDPDFDPETQGADLLSDEYGWCVFSFDYQWI